MPAEGAGATARDCHGYTGRPLLPLQAIIGGPAYGHPGPMLASGYLSGGGEPDARVSSLPSHEGRIRSGVPSSNRNHTALIAGPGGAD